MNKWLSIDPGNVTGICLWNGETPLQAWKIGGGKADHIKVCGLLAEEVNRCISKHGIKHIVVEIPINNGHGNAPLKQAEKVGVIVGVAGIRAVPVHRIGPTEWAASVGITGRGIERKQQSLALAGDYLDGIRDHNVADAVCIGLAWNFEKTT